MMRYNLNIVKVSKLFYGSYPYKITYKRLYSFPKQLSVLDLSFNPLKQGNDKWWFDYPKTTDDEQMRMRCYKFLKTLGDVKFNNGSHTHVYFETKKSYDEAASRYVELQEERSEPLVENLAELYEQSEKRIHIRKSLYFKKYRYKIQFRANKNFTENVGYSLFEMYKDNPNYRMNSNMIKFDKLYVARHKNRRYIHSPYNLYALYCLEEIDMNMATFVASECVSTITKAVLLSDLDK